MKKAGFSTVELLIALFVAAAFLTSGYQLYAMIIKDGGETRAKAKASNIAYDYLQQYKTDSNFIKSPCSFSTFTPDITSITDLPNAELTVNITCPYAGSNPAVTQILVKLTYGNNKEVIHTTYATTE